MVIGGARDLRARAADARIVSTYTLIDADIDGDTLLSRVRRDAVARGHRASVTSATSAMRFAYTIRVLDRIRLRRSSVNRSRQELIGMSASARDRFDAEHVQIACIQLDDRARELRAAFETRAALPARVLRHNCRVRGCAGISSGSFRRRPMCDSGADTCGTGPVEQFEQIRSIAQTGSAASHRRRRRLRPSRSPSRTAARRAHVSSTCSQTIASGSGRAIACLALINAIA